MAHTGCVSARLQAGLGQATKGAARSSRARFAGAVVASYSPVARSGRKSYQFLRNPRWPRRAVALGLLQLLWAPIAVDLAGGQLVSPRELLLLVGFVAVWLALVLVFGVLHAWISAWWSLELAQTGEAVRPRAQETSP